MGLIPEAVIEEVLGRSDILRTARNYVSLKKSGANYKGLCPFHDENTPSFFVHPGKGIYKCFGCGAGGNVISFLMDIEGLGFPQAVRQLAERNGVEIPDQDPEAAERARRRRKGKKLYFDIMQRARAFFEDNLWDDAGAAARQYLAEREIDEQTARDFGLGYAPDGWQHLLDHLGGHGLDARLVHRAGLALERSKSSGYYDRFRHRIVFPVVDIWNHTLAFGGRTIATNDDAPKYINSPETKFYTKGDQLYGLHAAKQAIQQAGYAVVVEGNFDVICLHAKGFETAVAPMGTALTEQQARLLSRYCDQVIVAFDGDQAGEEATVRCLEPFSTTNLQPLVIRFDELQDPDTFVRRQGAQALSAKIDNARPLVGWALDGVLTPAEGTNVERKLAALDEVGEILEHLSDAITWKHYAQEVSRRLSIAPDLLEEYIRRPASARSRVRQAVVQAHQPLELDAAEHGILTMLLGHPEWLESFLADDLDNLLSTRELAEFLEQAVDHYRKYDQIKPAILLEAIGQPAFQRTVTEALADDELDPDKALRFYKDCIRSLKKKWASRTLDELTRQLDHIDFYDDRDRYEQLTRQKQEIDQFKASLDWKPTS